MAGRTLIRHLLAPMLALLLSIGITWITLTPLDDPAVIGLVLVLVVGCWFLCRPRPGVGKAESRKPLRIWRAIAPFAAFLAGPIAVVVLWLVTVHGVESELYATSQERIDELTGALPIGFLVGFVGALVVWAWLAPSD